MRTSQSQFELIIDYMERHGDLNKLGGGPQERVAIIQHWDKLTKALNTDKTGDNKTTEKWKKVWSDLKNNTKKKAAKIHKATNENGESSRTKLSTLEKRVLNLMKSQAVTGLSKVNEVSYEHVPTAAPIKRAGPSPQNVVLIPDSTPTVLIESSLENEKIFIKEEDGQFKLLSSIEVDCSPLSRESIQDQTHATPRASPSPTVPTSRRRSTSQRRTTRRNFPRASTAPGHSASRYFVESDERWRSLFNKLATEHFRLREAELQQQAQWQVLFEKMITTINKFAE